MSNKLTSSQKLYYKLFKELPEQDIDEIDIPELISVIETIAKKEAQLLRMRLGLVCDKKTCKEIAIEFGFNPEDAQRYAHRIENSALRKLRNEPRSSKIKLLFATRKELRLQIEKLNEQAAELQSKVEKLGIENYSLTVNHPKIEQSTSEAYSFLDEPIENFNWSVRVYICLTRARPKIKTIGDIIQRYKDDKLITIRNIGKKTYTEIEQKLLDLGVKPV